MGPWFWS